MHDPTAKLITHAKNLVHLHLGQAVDSCIIAKRYSDPSVGGSRPLQHRYSAASVIHGYAALEGVANRIKFQVYENRDSPVFSELAAEPIAVRRLIADWRDHVKLEDKIAFLLERRGGALDSLLRVQLADVRGLRNLVAHGWIAETILEYARTPEGFIELKDSLTDYKSQFGAIKFSPPDELTFSDAQSALRAVFEAAHKVLAAYGMNDMAIMYEAQEGYAVNMGLGEVADPIAKIMEFIEAAPTMPLATTQ